MRTKRNLMLALNALALSAGALAAPTLTADPYPSTATQPDTATLTVNGGTPIACTLPSSAAGLTPTCNLASITASGTYTLVLTVSKAAGCSSTTSPATCDGGGTASSTPFVYTLRAGSVTAPVLRLLP